MTEPSPIVGVIMGSDSDLGVMRAAVDALREFDIPCEVRILSAHRTPDEMLGLRALSARRAGSRSSSPGRAARRTCRGWSPRRPRCR